MREKSVIEKEISEVKKQLGNSGNRMSLAYRLHDLNNELGLFNKIERGNEYGR